MRVEQLYRDFGSAYRAQSALGPPSSTEELRHLAPVLGSLNAVRLTTDAITRYCTPSKIREVPYIAMLPENNVRQGFVEDSDFARLVAEARKEELWLRVFLELAFTYGWRRGELLTLRVRQLNFAARTMRLEVGTTKNLKGREVAMTTNAAALLALAGKSPDDFGLTRA